MEQISSANKLIDNTKSIKMTGCHYPWGLYVGELRHPDRGHLMSAVIKNQGAGLIIEYPTGHIKSAVHLIEDMVAHFVLATIEHRRPVVNVLDLSLNNPFVGLLQMSEICKIDLQDTSDELNGFNAHTKALIRHRNTEVLTSDVPSIAQYNELCDPRAQEYYVVNIINFNDYIKNPDRLVGLSEILDNSEKVGIKFLFYVDRSSIDDTINMIDDEKARNTCRNLVQQILTKLPSITTSEHDIFLKNDNPDEIFKPLQLLIHQHGLTLELSSRGIHKHVFHGVIKDINDTVEHLEKNNDRPFLKIEIGVSPNGKTKRYFELGESNGAYHAFIIGKTGTGKTVFLDHIIKGIARQSTPKEAEIYLFDYKEGIGFAKYEKLPHTRVLMLDHSNKSAIYTYIKKFQSLIAERGELFTQNGVEKLSEYNAKNPNNPLSRVYLIIDEVQIPFKDDDDRLFSGLIEDIARRGRSVGLTMIMATQTLSGYSIPDVILSQFGLRIAFRVDVQDSISFFAIGNNSPIYLNKRECIINDKEGIVEGNKKVLVNASVPDSIISDLAYQYPDNYDKIIIRRGFEMQQDIIGLKKDCESFLSVDSSQNTESNYDSVDVDINENFEHTQERANQYTKDEYSSGDGVATQDAKSSLNTQDLNVQELQKMQIPCREMDEEALRMLAKEKGWNMESMYEIFSNNQVHEQS